jgi:hypothetical protein
LFTHAMILRCFWISGETLSFSVPTTPRTLGFFRNSPEGDMKTNPARASQ